MLEERERGLYQFERSRSCCTHALLIKYHGSSCSYTIDTLRDSNIRNDQQAIEVCDAMDNTFPREC